jgi:RNA polymerase sigma-70 factor (ECF subfamily)
MDKERFSQAVWAMRSSMLRLSMSLLRNQSDAEDAVSEAVLRAWAHRDTLRGDLKPWLLKIVANCCYSTMRTRKRLAPVADEHLFESPAQEDEAHTLWQYLWGMPENYRVVLSLFYYERMRVDEIAQALGIPRGTVTARLKRGRERLLKIMKEG